MGNLIFFICSKTDLTADLVLLEIEKRKNFEVLRFNVEDFPLKLGFTSPIPTDRNTILSILGIKSGGPISLGQIRSVYYRPHHEPRPSRKIKDIVQRELILEQSELVIEWLEDIIPCFWLNSPRACIKARSKVIQLKIASSVGFKIPNSIITNNPDDFLAFYNRHAGKVAAKLLQATPASRKLPGFIFTKRISPEDLKLKNQIKYFPVLFQEYVDKSFEVRATVVGKKVFAAKIDSQKLLNTQNDWRHYHFGHPPPHSAFSLPKEISKKLIKINDTLRINFGAYDLVYTPRGEYVFLEVNANGQWAWIQELTKLPIASAIANLLTSPPKK